MSYNCRVRGVCTVMIFRTIYLLRALKKFRALFVHRKPLAGRVVQKRLLPMGKNKTPSVIVEMRSGNCKLQNKGRPLKSE